MDGHSDRYDGGTQLWTTIFGAAVAAVVDWVAVVNPARGTSPVEPHKNWWVFALAFVSLAPASWLVSRLTHREYAQAVVWVFILVAVIVAQFIPLSWAQDQL